MKIMARRPHPLQPYTSTGSFTESIMAACFQLSTSIHTRKAYWGDARKWLSFCTERNVDPRRAESLAVAAWVESMKLDGSAPKTRSRRVAALSSIYDHLRRTDKLPRGPYGEKLPNPFSVSDGPKRERTTVKQPTPMARIEDVRAALSACGDTVTGVRDYAIMQTLWRTGMRRVSLVSMTFERLQREPDGYTSIVTNKGGGELKVFIGGHAGSALTSWLQWLRERGVSTGPIWRSENGTPMTEKEIWRVVRRRGKQAGLAKPLTPHMFRVAFLTLNPADLGARQDAVGHANPNTTRAYDRMWRGREAFEAMPEIDE